MANYKIIGADLLEYGPASAEQIRQWIAEGRVNSETKLQLEGGGAWKPLAEVPELAAAVPDTAPPACPKCGEPFEERFDSCWKCGTGRDGSPPKHAIPLEAPTRSAAVESGDRCPECGSRHVRRGKLLPGGGNTPVRFKPEGTRLFASLFLTGVTLKSDSSKACLHCGLVWGQLPPRKLREFTSKHCR